MIVLQCALVGCGHPLFFLSAHPMKHLAVLVLVHRFWFAVEDSVGRPCMFLIPEFFVLGAFYIKLKNVSCEYDRLNGSNFATQTLQPAWYIRHVGRAYSTFHFLQIETRSTECFVNSLVASFRA